MAGAGNDCVYLSVCVCKGGVGVSEEGWGGVGN